MQDPFVGQITFYPYNFAPFNWAICVGQILPITQFTALFSLLGTNFGGNGTSTFGLPDLRGRVPLGMGQLAGGGDYVIGEIDGPRPWRTPPRWRSTATPSTRPRPRAPPTIPPVHSWPIHLSAVEPGGSDREHLQSRHYKHHPGADLAAAFRQQPAAQQPAAVPGADALHRPAGRLPVAELTGWPQTQSITGAKAHE